MKATTQVLLAVCLLAKCFGNCEGKEEKNDVPRAAHIPEPAENEDSSTLEIIDLVPLRPAKEHWFNLIITFERNDHPGGRNDGSPEIVGVEPAKNPRETAQDNSTDEWRNNTVMYVAIAIAIALCLSILGLLVTIGYYQKHKRFIVASRSSSLAGASSGSSPPNAKVRLHPSRLGVANIKLVASLMDEKKTDDLNRLI